MGARASPTRVPHTPPALELDFIKRFHDGDECLEHHKLLGTCPIFRNQSGWLGPRNFHDGILKPLVPKICVLRDNDLKARTLFTGETIQHAEKLAHPFKIGVSLRFLDGSGCGLVNQLRRKIHLRWLVKEEDGIGLRLLEAK